MKKTIKCKYCKGMHVMETRNKYFCSKVFGGWVTIKRRKPKRVLDYKKCFNKQLDGMWTWEVPVWLTKAGMFANCSIKSIEGKLFTSQEEATADMDKVLTKLGIDK